MAGTILLTPPDIFDSVTKIHLCVGCYQKICKLMHIIKYED